MTEQSITVYTCDARGCMSNARLPLASGLILLLEWWSFTIATTDDAGTINQVGHACGRPHLRDAIDNAIERLEES